MELSGYFAVVRRWWWTLLVAAWVAGLAGFYVASRIPPTYESAAQLLVGPLNTDDVTLRASGQLIQTYATFATTPQVLTSAIQDAGSSMSADALAANTRASANDVNRVLTITVRAGDPDEAAAIANAISSRMIGLVGNGLNRPEGQLTPVQTATADPNAVAPQVSLIVLLSTAAGILAALVLVLLIEYLSKSIRTREELARLSATPVLGSVPAPVKSRPDPRDLAADESERARVYRVLAGRIVYGDPDDVLHSLAVVDVESETGSEVVALNLGAALARLGRRVVVIDGGVRGQLAALYGLDPIPGIRDVLAREAPVRSAMRAVGERLAVIPGGYEGGDLVDPDRAKAVVTDLLGTVDVVIVAASPVQAGPGALAWARAVDRSILVARRDHAKRDEVAAAAETLTTIGGHLAGSILAERPAPLAWLFGRGRSGSARTVSPPQMATPMAAPMAAPPVAGRSSARPPSPPPTLEAYRPAPAPTPLPSNPSPAASSPSALRPTIIRASAPQPIPAPVPEPAVEPVPIPPTAPATPARRSTSSRSRSSGRSSTTRTDPADAS